MTAFSPQAATCAMPTAFDAPVPAGGYAWWYVDALSDDGRFGLTIIAFIGSVFSPYYASARRHALGSAEPLDHCALNVALYSRNGSATQTGWAMTERHRASVKPEPTRLRIGPSQLAWKDGVLTIDIDEITVPWARQLKGVVRIFPSAVLSTGYALDDAGLHHWCPIAPSARVTVDLSSPNVQWHGNAYLDANRGARPLEKDFIRWDWSRAELSGQRTAVLYDATRIDGSPLSLALLADAAGQVNSFTPPPSLVLPLTAWRLPRSTRSESAAATHIEQDLEDGPFYSRSLLRTRLLGEATTAVHESLSLARWQQPVVQAMLPFRMPRWG